MKSSAIIFIVILGIIITSFFLKEKSKSIKEWTSEILHPDLLTSEIKENDVSANWIISPANFTLLKKQESDKTTYNLGIVLPTYNELNSSIAADLFNIHSKLRVNKFECIKPEVHVDEVIDFCYSFANGKRIDILSSKSYDGARQETFIRVVEVIR